MWPEIHLVPFCHYRTFNDDSLNWFACVVAGSLFFGQNVVKVKTRSNMVKNGRGIRVDGFPSGSWFNVVDAMCVIKSRLMTFWRWWMFCQVAVRDGVNSILRVAFAVHAIVLHTPPCTVQWRHSAWNCTVDHNPRRRCWSANSTCSICCRLVVDCCRSVAQKSTNKSNKWNLSLTPQTPVGSLFSMRRPTRIKYKNVNGKCYSINCSVSRCLFL